LIELNCVEDDVVASTKKQENKNMVNLDDIKDELTDYINIQIKKSFNLELENANKRLIREKNKAIITKNIIILILICLIGFLLYLLYDNNYFDKYFSSDPEIIKVNENDLTENKNEETLKRNELINEYGYLIDNIIINEESIYVNDYYSGNLTTELKNYLTLNMVNFNELFIENDYNIIDNSYFIEYYNKLFIDEYESNTFEYNGIEVRYIQKLESYITDNILVSRETNIKKEIIDVEVNEEEVIITSVEGIVKDDKLYNIISLKVIDNYKKDSLANYESELNKVIYTFKDNKLISIK